MTRRAWLVLFAIVLAGCPKQHKPPAMDRVWLGTSDGCAHVRTGELACWGADFGGGQARITDAFGAGAAVRDVALGDRYQCVLRDDGTITCREGGKLAPFAFSAVTAIGAGGAHACAITGGDLRCWGDNTYGQLGDGTTEARTAPVKVPLPGPAKSLALGRDTTCVAVGAPKVVKCFGRGATSDDLLAGEDVTQLTVGLGHACALLASGGVRCWGADVHGQVGEGNRDVKHYPPEAAKVGPSLEVRAGYNHTCAHLRDNTVVCWGDNKRHQMADGTTDSRLEPVRIQGLYSVAHLAAAGDATCAVMALDRDVRCWGANDKGQLGDGSTAEQTVPMPLRFAATK